MKTIFNLSLISMTVILLFSCNQIDTSINKLVLQEEMEAVFNEIKTPFKYGVVVQHPDSTKMVDSPTIFRENDVWYMTYIVFDGQGYEIGEKVSRFIEYSGLPPSNMTFQEIYNLINPKTY